MFSLILVLISISLVTVLILATLYASGDAQHAQQLREAREQQRIQQQMQLAEQAEQQQQAQQQPVQKQHVVFRSEKLGAQRANEVLDQAQQLLGAATIYAGQHGGTFPTMIAELAQGHYLSNDVTPPDWVSTSVYRLESDKDGFRVSLMITDVSTCQHIQDMAMQTRTGAPYSCVADGGAYLFTFKG